MSSLVYLLLLFVSSHACNARYLWDTDCKETPKGSRYFREGVIQQEMEKEKPIGHNDQIDIHGNSGGANNIKHIEIRVPWSGKEDTIGFKITASSSPVGLQEATTIEEWQRRARLMLGHASGEAEETIDSKENEAADEDIVARDYAQPHKKTPIHN